MKRDALIAAAVLVFMMAACKKSSTTNTPYLVAKWTVVVDSTYSPGKGGSKATVYVGAADDYFDFRADNKCYIKEGYNYDTVAYTYVTDTTLMIQLFNYPSEVGKIKRNSANNISITTNSLANPLNGFIDRTVNLAK